MIMVKTKQQSARNESPVYSAPYPDNHPLATTASHHFADIRHDPDKITDLFRNGTYPYKNRIKKDAYENHLAELQVELLKVQSWVKQTGQRIIVLFEGRDAAGKGGTIKRFMEHLNPRAARVVALEKPTERETGQWYFQRYIEHLPSTGEMTLFDRSWYNRAGVERVMGFCSSLEYLEFMRQVPDLERMLSRSGIRLFKYWFSVTQEEQQQRFEARESDPLKQW
jgi:polyphosphate kinase 2